MWFVPAEKTCISSERGRIVSSVPPHLMARTHQAWGSLPVMEEEQRGYRGL